MEYHGNIPRSEGTKLMRKKQKPKDLENWRCFVFPKTEQEEKAGSVYSTDEGGSCSLNIYFSIPGVLFQEDMGDEPFQMLRQQRSDGNGDMECWGSRHSNGDQDTETFKAEIIPGKWISFGRTGIKSVGQQKPGIIHDRIQ